MSLSVPFTIEGISKVPDDLTSPETTTSPFVTSVSHATCELLSCVRRLSNMASEIASQTLSGCPSVTDSEVNKYFDKINS